MNEDQKDVEKFAECTFEGICHRVLARLNVDSSHEPAYKTPTKGPANCGGTALRVTPPLWPEASIDSLLGRFDMDGNLIHVAPTTGIYFSVLRIASY